MRLTSASNPRIKTVARLRRRKPRRGEKLFVAEGRREVTRAIEAGLIVQDVYFSPELLGRAIDLDVDIPPVEVAPDVFAKMTYRRDPEGILAVVEEPHWSLDQLPQVSDKTLYLVAVGTEKPGNLGAMVRTAQATGCDAVLSAEMPGITVDVFNPNAIRASTCAVFSLPTISSDEATVLDYLTSRRINLVAATPSGKVAYTDADWSRPLAVVIGPEDRGLSESWLSAASQRVSIPVKSGLVDSLNASNAAAVLLYEAIRHQG